MGWGARILLLCLVTMGCTTEGSWSNCLLGQEVFLHWRIFRWVLGPNQPPLQWVHALFPLGVKWPECEAYHPSPFNDEVKNEWSYASVVCGGATLPYVFLQNTLPSTFVFSLECWNRMTSGRNTCVHFKCKMQFDFKQCTEDTLRFFCFEDYFFHVCLFRFCFY
jgi:hypothetical protein